MMPSACSVYLMPTAKRRFARTAEQWLSECIIPEPNSGCWLWYGWYDSRGYGRVKLGGEGYRQFSAHRLSWEHYRGNIPDGMHVCHKCDNPACVNPDHLFLGRHLENNRDKAVKMRGVKSKKGLPFGTIRAKSGLFHARVKMNGKTFPCGKYKTALEASEAALKRRSELHAMEMKAGL